MPAQPWLELLDPVSKRAFSILRGTSTPEERDQIRAWIEKPAHAHQQNQNARMIAAILGGHGPIKMDPCPLPVLLAAITAWTHDVDVACNLNPAYHTLITYVDDQWVAIGQNATKAALEDSRRADDFTCASLRGHSANAAVWVVKCGMVDYRDPRHPHSGSPQAATLRRDGMYHLPIVPTPAPPVSTPVDAGVSALQPA